MWNLWKNSLSFQAWHTTRNLQRYCIGHILYCLMHACMLRQQWYSAFFEVTMFWKLYQQVCIARIILDKISNGWLQQNLTHKYEYCALSFAMLCMRSMGFVEGYFFYRHYLLKSSGGLLLHDTGASDSFSCTAAFCHYHLPVLWAMFLYLFTFFSSATYWKLVAEGMCHNFKPALLLLQIAMGFSSAVYAFFSSAALAFLPLCMNIWRWHMARCEAWEKCVKYISLYLWLSLTGSAATVCGQNSTWMWHFKHSLLLRW